MMSNLLLGENAIPALDNRSRIAGISNFSAMTKATADLNLNNSSIVSIHTTIPRKVINVFCLLRIPFFSCRMCLTPRNYPLTGFY